jgi:SAM-dependent methyltransferase
MKFYKFILRKCSDNVRNTIRKSDQLPTLQEISKKFWSDKTKKADLDSMCGFKELNSEDLLQTLEIIPKERKFNRALDVGSGIGRISYNILYNICESIDLLDINSDFLEIAKLNQIEKINHGEIKEAKIKKFYNTEIQKFDFEEIYDLVFIQWVLEYLDNRQLRRFMKNIHRSLTDDGIVIIKENVNMDDNENLIYPNEGSFIRPFKKFEEIFHNEFNIESTNQVKYKSVNDLCDIKFWLLSKKYQ